MVVIRAEAALNRRQRVPTDWERAAALRIADLRTRLLDLTNSNRLLNFKFRERSRNYVRIIETSVDGVFTRLGEGERFLFRALPEKSGEPPDEKTDRFLMALEQARRSDAVYREEIDAIDDDPEGELALQIERRLKDRVREQLGLPPLKDLKELSLSQYAKLHGFDPSFDLPRRPTDRSSDNLKKGHLQLLLLPEQMERSLSGVSDQTRTVIQEKGVNTLFLAYGFLEWYESDASEKPMFAPLLLQQIDIERKLALSKYQYRTGSLGEDTDINVTLSERLARDFGLRLPPFEEEETPEKYFYKFEKIIEAHPRWRVRRFLVIGHFAFARLVMYNDIDPKLWPGAVGIAGDENILKLFAGEDEQDQQSSFLAEQYEVDSPKIAAKVPLLITEADSSQFSAIADVMDGKNLALKGPPGTGKSQTITNIIAAALAKGQRVLFVAEKIAALDVVKDRLSKAGLGEFCFEVHSTKARKQDLLSSLKQRLDIQDTLKAPQQLDKTIAELEKLRDQLTSYVSLVNSNFGISGKTIHHILWAEQRTRQNTDYLPKGVDGIRLDDADALTEADLEERRMKLEALGEFHERTLSTYGSISRHPWCGIESLELNLFDQEDACALAKNVKLALERYGAGFSTLGVPKGSVPNDLMSTDKIAVELSRLSSERTQIDKSPLVHMGDHWNREALRELRDSLARIHEATRALSLLGRSEEIAASPNGVKLLVEAAKKYDLEGHTVASIAAYTEHLKFELNEWRQGGLYAKALLKAFGFPDNKGDFSLLRRIISAVNHLAAVPRELLELRDVKLIEGGAGIALEEAQAKAKALNDLFTEIRTRFVLVRSEDPDALKSCATSLRTSNVWGLFKADVRAAKRKYKSLCKNAQRKSRRQMADDLDEIARAFLELTAFQTDAKLRALCGSRFKGISTPFGDLATIRLWMLATESAASTPDDVDDQIRGVLLRETSERLCRLLELAKNPEHSMLERLLNTSALPHGNINERISSLEAKTKVTATAKALSDQIGLFEKTSFGSLQKALDALNVQIIARREIVENTRAKDVCAGKLNYSEPDEIYINQIVDIAESIANSGLPDAIKDQLFSSAYDSHLENFRRSYEKLNAASTEVKLAWKAFKAKTQVNENVFFGAPLETSLVESLLPRIDAAVAAPSELGSWIEYRRAERECAEVGLKVLIDIFGDELSVRTLRDAFERAYHRSLARLVLERHPSLGKMHGVTLRQARERFQELDRKILKLHQQSLASKLCRSPIDQGIQTPQKKDYTGLVLINNELSKKQRHVALRTLLDRAGKSIQQMKPCFMMSPPSVAQFLKPGGLRFDLLVIDEASQMRPEEALGSIARADQVVVVGDPMQLPPTSFFDSVDHPIDNDQDAEEFVDSESILDLALNTYRPARALLWHYRSRHESLIAFSNKHFYDDKLIVFPSPLDPDKSRREPQFGIFHHFVEGRYKSSLNIPEAEIVAEAAVAFMRNNPDRSLGIVTLNQPQREVLLGEIDRLIARDRQAAGYLEKWEPTLEPFFVKNLENVQGDERDVIFISTVYGPDANTGVVMNRFGPVNSNVGHRRLNVLFSRAKQRVDVFTSMHSGDVKISDKSSRGVRELKAYLEYSETGRLEQGIPTNREPDSEFEVFVRDRLVQHGFEVAHQVGVAGYSIDLAIKHPSRSGYLLGIECDGATYHSSKSARDRDRLREEVLTRLKWNIYRIWSTDWFANPQQEFNRLLSHIDKLATGKSAQA